MEMYCRVIQYMQLHIHSFTGDFFQDSNKKLGINKQQRKKTMRKENKNFLRETLQGKGILL
jgi:hypothetical protein